MNASLYSSYLKDVINLKNQWTWFDFGMRDVSMLMSGNKQICSRTPGQIRIRRNSNELLIWIHWPSGACRNISVLCVLMLRMMWRKGCELQKKTCYEALFNWIFDLWNTCVSRRVRDRVDRHHSASCQWGQLCGVCLDLSWCKGHRNHKNQGDWSWAINNKRYRSHHFDKRNKSYLASAHRTGY